LFELSVVYLTTDAMPSYWEEAARNLIKGLILHVLSAAYLREHRNLVTVRRLLTQGDWLTLEELRDAGDGDDMPSAFEVLWSRMRRNPAFNGVVAGVGEQMIGMADKQRSGVLESARTNTEFLDSIPMQRLLETSDFDLGELKTNPQGLTVYLTLPQRFMETHYRWLRLMIVLAVGEMERIKGRPATGHPTLFLLDEFAGLKRMEVIENAAAQAAGFGIKFLFVVQNLPQLQDLYDKSWETFFGNSGLKLFFHIDDDFTKNYLSRQLGEVETLRQTQSGSQSQSTNRSTTDGQSFSTNTGTSSGVTAGSSTGHSRNYGRFFTLFLTGRGSQSGENWSSSTTQNWGRSASTSLSTSQSAGDSTTSGWGEGVHKRPLLNPDEIGRLLARIDDRRRPGYPGLVLALVPGEYPLLARRVNYFESPWFLGYFDPHPDHRPPLTLDALSRAATQTRSESRNYLRLLTARRVAIGFGAALSVGAVVYLSGMSPWGSSAMKPAPPKFDFGTPEKIPSAPPKFDFGPPVRNVPADDGTTVPAPQPARPVEPQPQPEINPSYAQGAADWRKQKAWFDAQTGDYRVGAEYWAANRRNRDVPADNACAIAASNYAGQWADFAAGCLDAKILLDPFDARRADPQYKAGFNDAAAAASPAGAVSTNPAKFATVSTVNLNLRVGPGPAFASVATLPEGTKVKILKDADNGWQELEVSRSGGVLRGFANSTFLRSGAISAPDDDSFSR
jgi:Type IV secretory system Conjugative DNA transfer/Bacterial SH3 domain